MVQFDTKETPLKIKVLRREKAPIHQQISDQIHFAINTGKLAFGDQLPSLRSVARENSIAINTVVKAFKTLEDKGLIKAKYKSAYTVASKGKSVKGRYARRGVSSTKQDVHAAVSKLDSGIFPQAFCKVTEDFLTGNPDKCNIIHSDGSGTKSILAYLFYRETGDPTVFRGIAQDSIVMNLDDLLCVGATGRIVLSGTINRNAKNISKEVLAELIDGQEAFLSTMRDNGIDIHSGGGETADVGDLTGSVVVDSAAVAVMSKTEVITGKKIQPGLAIVGLSSSGQSSYESQENSGIGSNGLTSARHDLLSAYYKRKFPETFDKNIDPKLVYCGPFRMADPLPGTDLTVGEALLSPTRTYAPVIASLLGQERNKIRGLIHCSGGGQTKCLHFGRGIHFIKDSLMPIPPIFKTIQRVSRTGWKEMYQVYNMGHRMEIYCKPRTVKKIIQTAADFGIHAEQIGHTEKSDRKDNNNHLTLFHGKRRLTYK